MCACAHVRGFRQAGRLGVAVVVRLPFFPLVVGSIPLVPRFPSGGDGDCLRWRVGFGLLGLGLVGLGEVILGAQNIALVYKYIHRSMHH